MLLLEGLGLAFLLFGASHAGENTPRAALALLKLSHVAEKLALNRGRAIFSLKNLALGIEAKKNLRPTLNSELHARQALSKRPGIAWFARSGLRGCNFRTQGT